MIQCDECDAWQHCACIGFNTEEDCPGNYFCSRCAPSDRGRKLEDYRDRQDAMAAKWERDCTPPPQRAAQLEPVSSSGVDMSDDDDNELEVENPSPLLNGSASPSLHSLHSRSSERYPPHIQSSRKYMASLHSLTQPNTSPLIRPTPSHPLLTPTKSSKKQSTCSTVTLAEPAPFELHASSVALPNHYLAILSLHSAVERALLLHLATDGSRACGVAAMAQASAGDFTVDLPNLVSYSAIRSVVERGAGKRFGPTELGQLIWLWEGGLHGPHATESSEMRESAMDGDENAKRRGGLSISVGPTREMDKTTGKKVYTWGLGIVLHIKQNVQLPAFEMIGPQSPSSASGKTAISPRSPSNMGRSVEKRQGMSVMPLWSSRSDARKEEMRRRLGECVIKAHADFASSSLLAGSAAARKAPSFNLTSGLPTPPPSSRKHERTSSATIGDGFAAQQIFKKGFILDALPPIPSSSLPPLGPAASSPMKKAAQVCSPHLVADVDARIARADATAEKRKFLEEGVVEADTPRAPANQRAMSLLERVIEGLPLDGSMY